MAISYVKNIWNTEEPYSNFTPTKMNTIESGIKAACDGVDTLNSNLQTNLAGIKVRTGSIDVTLTPNGVTTITIPLSSVFTVAPKMFFTARTSAGAGTMINARVSTISATSATVNVETNRSTAATITLDWLAIG